MDVKVNFGSHKANMKFVWLSAFFAVLIPRVCKYTAFALHVSRFKRRLN